MKNPNIVIVILSIIPFFISCSIHHFTIEVIEPSKFSLPANIKNIGLVITSPDLNIKEDTADYNKKMLDSLIAQNIYDGFNDAFSASPLNNYVTFIDKPVIISNTSTNDSTYIDKITSKNNIDCVILVDVLNIKEARRYRNKTPINITMRMETKWKIYSIHDKSKSFEYILSEKYQYEPSYHGTLKKYKELPRFSQLYFVASKSLGYTSGNNIFPSWVERYRYIYPIKAGYAMETQEYIKENNWLKAAEIWYSDSTNIPEWKEAKVAHNMAVAYEMEGNLELAEKWAVRSCQLNNTPENRQYLRELKNRKAAQSKLSFQLQSE